ncbi:MAG TPA: DUF2459 domain-containing protein [Steroidobacteraceae bacterium]
MTVFLIRRRWHLEIGFYAADLGAPLDAIRASLPDARFITFGFGDRHYLEARERDVPNLLAALWPGAGLILATSLRVTPQQAFGEGNVVALQLDPSRGRAAQQFIWQSLARNDRTLRPQAPGPYPDTFYFASSQRYSAIHTCNTWAAEALQAAAVPVHSVGVLFAWQLWMQVRGLRAARLPQPPSPLPSG